MTTLVMKNLVCGMADILWKEEQDICAAESFRSNNDNHSVVHGVENIHCKSTHPANKLLHYPGF